MSGANESTVTGAKRSTVEMGSGILKGDALSAPTFPDSSDDTVPPARLSAEQIAVRAGALEANVHVIFRKRADQHPIRLNMAIAAAREMTALRVIFELLRQRAPSMSSSSTALSFAMSLPRLSMRLASFL